MICPDCRTPEILGEMCDEITNYRNMEKHNPFLEDYVLKQGPEFRLTSLLPGLIEFMTGEQKEYQQCLYDYIARNAQFESEAKEYWNRSAWKAGEAVVESRKVHQDETHR